MRGRSAERTGLSVHTHLCTRLRASGMPLPMIREYAALVREGPATVAMYEEHLAADGDDPLWAG
ncbi:hypothetical protein [Actinomadura sp. NPDC048394]|uniref:hypothetical protein n=1 Tax=Actinomadura sp. NPDC048394 TaxID=3158223 RepID=UPI0034079350